MSPVLRDLGDKAVARMWERLATPDIEVTSNPDGWSFASPYSQDDRDRWEALLFDAFATRSNSVMQMFVGQLAALCSTQFDKRSRTWRPNERELVAAIQIVRSLDPRNEAQACLAAQAVAVHLATMKLGEQVGKSAWPDARTIAVMAKSARTYAHLVETMERLKGKRRASRQTIIVKHEKHVHQHQHVHLDGGASQKGGRSDEHMGRGAGCIIGITALRGENKGGPALSVPGHAGQEALPPSRIRRRSKGSG